MFYAWRLVKRELILNTNKLCVDSEKTSVKVVFCWCISECSFYPGYNSICIPVVCASKGLHGFSWTHFLILAWPLPHPPTPHLESCASSAQAQQNPQSSLALLPCDICNECDIFCLSICDNDGEFLLIEAAHFLPKWLQPDTSQNRVRREQSQVITYESRVQVLVIKCKPGTNWC